MAWTDEARAAAAEARKNHSKGSSKSQKIADGMFNKLTSKTPLRIKVALSKKMKGG